MSSRPDDPDDATQRIGDDDVPVDDESTRYMPASEPDDDEVATQYLADDESTRYIPVEDAATRPVDTTRPISPAYSIEEEGGPRTERIAVQAAAQRSIAGGLIATLVVLALIIGAVLGYSQRDPHDRNVLDQALVGPGGGTLTFGDGGRLEIPRGALPTATSIKIRQETVDRPIRLGAKEDPRSRVYQPGELVVYAFEPSDLRFQHPARISLPRQDDGQAVLIDIEGEDDRVIPAETRGDVVVIETISFSFETGSTIVDGETV